MYYLYLFQQEDGYMILYHGAQRWSGLPMIMPHRQGEAEHGPGIYFTTSWETAKKYSKGSGSVYRMTIDNPRSWVEDSDIPLSEVIPFINNTLRGKKALAVKNSIERVAARLKTGMIPASVLVNTFVNNDVASGQAGPPLAEFLVNHGIDASLVHQGADDWVVLFNPKLIQRVEKLSSKEVNAPGFQFDLPRISKVAQRIARKWLSV
jgi:hypothetical protein